MRDGDKGASPAGSPTSNAKPCHDRDASYPAGPDHHGAATAVASWVEGPSTEREMRGKSELVAHVEVVSVTPGAPIVATDVPADEAAHTAIPTQDVELLVCDKFAGSVPSKVTVMQYGNETLSLEGDPPYTVGQQYVMYLRRFHDGTGKATERLLPVSVDGRLYVRRDGRLEHVTHTPKVKELADRPLPDVARAIKGASA